jgi:transcriptional regulator with XRE-family HTH domain
LRELRNQAGLTQEQLAARVDVGATYVSQIENGHRGLRWDTLLRVLRALGADLHQLADPIEEPDGQ